MFHRNKSIILRIAFLIFFVLLIGICFWPTNPYNKIEKKIGLTLPPSSKVQKFSYNKIHGDLYAKVQINDHDLDSIRKDLLSCFHQEYDKKHATISNNITDNILWWDMDNKRIEECYHKSIYKKTIFDSNCKCMSEAWAFIVKYGADKHNLYIIY